MEKSRRQHQSSKARVYEEPDKQARKPRHSLRASQPHKARPHSPAGLEDPNSTSRPKTTTDRNEHLVSWLNDAYAHRNHPPESENDQKHTLGKQSRERKRPRSADDFSDSPEEGHLPRGKSFEKRPRYKTRKDKYDYKDGSGRKHPPSGQGKGLGRDEHKYDDPQYMTRRGNHGNVVGKFVAQLNDMLTIPQNQSKSPQGHVDRETKGTTVRGTRASFKR
ncbi:hypothetical protein QBC37DRAFT_368545 [Rhypophila decipiens]|uniref:Uncharacterized protein n=1 Tax=Rhypophila decipiens TaxID=261697 RepID=A0AAN6YG42_9PEZI|nr:hypothetical protein QBC37DRAFT_368545 [Rhypophila decipiens]